MDAVSNLSGEPRFAYVLNGMAWPSHNPLDEEEELGQATFGRVRLRKVGVRLPGDPRNWPGRDRFLLEVEGGLQDDQFALRLAEAMAATLTLVYGPLGYIQPSAFRVPKEAVRGDVITLGRLVDRGELVGDPDLILVDWEHGVRTIINQAIGVPQKVIVEVLRCLPATIEDPIFTSAHYYLASTMEMCFVGGDRDLALSRHPQLAASSLQAASMQNAVHNAFKAVEALIGEPPSDDQRFTRKLREIGVDPEMMAGWPVEDHPKEPIWMKVRQLHQNRDKRAAHARTGNRKPLTYFDVLDSQGCAETILQAATLHALGAPTDT